MCMYLSFIQAIQTPCCHLFPEALAADQNLNPFHPYHNGMQGLALPKILSWTKSSRSIDDD